MMHKLLFIFFKVFNSAGYTFHKWHIKYWISYYFYISKNRFVLDPSLIIGKRFSINSDISNTCISIKANCRLRDNFNITIGNNGHLSIGLNGFFNNNCSINCLGKIEIGNNNQFGEAVLMYDHNHVHVNKAQLISEQGYNIDTIKIGNNCWIGSHVVILKGVEIGDNVVIGSGCIIFKSIPSNSMVTNHQNLVIQSDLKKIE